jgi:hypothetical protein
MSDNKRRTLKEYGAGIDTEPHNEDLVLSCRECGVGDITPSTRHTDFDWRCKSCGAKFDEPVRRRKKGKSVLTGAPAMLEQMDPEEFDRRVNDAED